MYSFGLLVFETLATINFFDESNLSMIDEGGVTSRDRLSSIQPLRSAPGRRPGPTTATPELRQPLCVFRAQHRDNNSFYVSITELYCSSESLVTLYKLVRKIIHNERETEHQITYRNRSFLQKNEVKESREPWPENDEA